ncbi:MAG TPA: SigE family RNA polymerase sigma factor [Ornithinibacter sp.]|nr:SigE family RNA polymerase sigma factor [Ornithinibacter sp.]
MSEMPRSVGLAPPRVERDEAFGVLFRTHASGLVRLAYCLLGDREAAEDAVQEAFLSLYRNWDGLRDHGSSHAYLRAAVLNRSRSGQGQLVRARRIRGRLASVDWPEPSSESRMIQRDDAKRLAAAVRALPRRQREVVVCRYYLELTESETAAMLDIGLGSVKRHAHRGLTRLQDRLGDSR